MFLKTPKNLDEKWRVRRGIAVGCYRLMAVGFLWTFGLITYAIVSGKNMEGFIAAATIISFFITCFTGVIGKYMHDASKEGENKQ